MKELKGTGSCLAIFIIIIIIILLFLLLLLYFIVWQPKVILSKLIHLDTWLTCWSIIQYCFDFAEIFK